MIASNTIIVLQYYAVKNAVTSNTLIVFATIGIAGSAGIIVNSLQFGIEMLHHLKLPPISAGILVISC